MKSAKSYNKLSSDFLIELLYAMLHYKTVRQIMITHWKYEYIPEKLYHYKAIMKVILDWYKEKSNVLTNAMLKQKFADDDKCVEIIDKVGAKYLKDHVGILITLEELIKRAEFAKMYGRASDLYNAGLIPEGLDYLLERSKKILQIDLCSQDSKLTYMYRDFAEGIYEVINEKQLPKIPTPITALNDLLQGGIDVQDTVLIMGPSNIGKSTTIRSFAYHAHRLGFRVLHIQCEGARKEVLSHYTQMWSQRPYLDIITANMTDEDIESLRKKSVKLKALYPDICVTAVEKLGHATMHDIYDAVAKYEEENQYSPDMIVLDSLDLMSPGKQKYEGNSFGQKLKIHQTSQLLKNLAVAKKCAIVTVTQCSSVPERIRENHDKVIKTEHLEWDKTLDEAFSVVLSLNQTSDEYQENKMRLYVQKFRNQRKTARVIPFITAFDAGYLVDYNRTEEYYKSIDNDNRESNS